MQDDIFNHIPLNECFKRRSAKILQRKQKKYDYYNPFFIKWALYIPNKKVRNTINQAFHRCRPYLDKVFLDRFPIKSEFPWRFWELFLCNFLLTKDITLESKKKNEGTPDFCILFESRKIWIEARSPSEHDSIKDLWSWVHQLDEISMPRYLRLSGAFIDKSITWYETYLKNWCKVDEPFIIAINGSEIDSWSTDKWMLGILYGIWLTQFDKNWNMSYQNLSHLKKNDTESFEIWYFRKPEFSHVSWVIYLESSIDFENEDIVVEHESFQYIPNINAKNPVPDAFIEKLNLHIPINFQ